MKLLLTLATLTLAGATFVGCKSAPKTVASKPISAEALSSLRASFMQAEPNARVGSVDEVLEKSMYLTVGQINPSEFPIGTAVSIIDSNRQSVAFGEVVRTFDQTVHVRYEKNGIVRGPRVGDAAVRFEAGKF